MFSHILIDEAGQTLECEAIIPFLLTTDKTRVVLAGDHMQMTLPVRSPIAKQKDFHISLLERLAKHYSNEITEINKMERYCILLNKNYRNQSEISGFLSQYFYQNSTKIVSKKNDQTENCCFRFCNINGKEEPKSLSYFNESEAQLTCSLVKRLVENNTKPETIAVICNYKAQIDLLRRFLRQEGFNKVVVLSTEAVQGEEYDTVIINIVRTEIINKDSDEIFLGFLTDPKLVNTVLSRSKNRAIVIGNTQSLISIGECQNFWRCYIDYCSSKNTVESEVDMKEILSQRERKDSFEWERKISADVILKKLGENQDSYSAMSIYEKKLSPNTSFKPLKVDIKHTLRDGIQISAEDVDETLTNEDAEKIRDASDWRQSEQHESVEYLENLLESQPDVYKKCRMVIVNIYNIWAEFIEGTKLRKIAIDSGNGRGRTFNNDIVVVQINSKTLNECFGKVVGILEREIDLRQALFVCWPDVIPGYVVPIDFGVPKISLKSLRRKEGRGNVIQIHRMTKDERIELEKEEIVDPSDPYRCLFVVRYLKWTKNHRYPLGVAVRSIIARESKEVIDEILRIEHNIPNKMRQDVIRAVAYFNNYDIPQEIKHQRQDYTQTCVFTIDPQGSKDLDDAISFEKIDNEKLKVGVHIADVSLFANKNNLNTLPIYEQALERGTSIYSRIGECIHMLPEALSSNICSLLPNQTRLTKSLFFTITAQGEIIDEGHLINSYIQSKRQFDYEEVQKILDGNEELNDLNIDFKTLFNFTKSLRFKRMGNNAFSQLNARGDWYAYDAHCIVEELMVATNSIIASFLNKKFQNFPIRRQMPPEDDSYQKWKNDYQDHAVTCFEIRDKYLGFERLCHCQERCTCLMTRKENQTTKILFKSWLKIADIISSDSIEKFRQALHNILLSDNYPFHAVGITESRQISQRGEYINCNTENEVKSHFTLKEHLYTHFTSPIRRIVDLVNHILLDSVLSESSGIKFSAEEISKICSVSNLKTRKSKLYEKDTEIYGLAFEMREMDLIFPATLQSINGKYIEVNPLGFEYLKRSDKFLSLSSLNLHGEPAIKEEDDSVLLTWEARIYVYGKVDNNEYNTENRVDFTGRDYCMNVNSDVWEEFLSVVTKNEKNNIREKFENVKSKIVCNGKRKVPLELSSEIHENKRWKDIKGTKKRVALKTNQHFRKFTLRLKKGDIFNIQIGAKLYRGLLVPKLQYLSITPKFGICIDHLSNPTSCFVNTKIPGAYRTEYHSVREYADLWLPIMHLEAVDSAIEDGACFTIRNLPIDWRRDPVRNDDLSGKLQIDCEFILERQVIMSVGDYFCIRYRRLRTKQKLKKENMPLAKNLLANSEEGVWICHATCTGISLIDENGKRINKRHNLVSEWLLCSAKPGTKFVIELSTVSINSHFPEELLNNREIITDNEITVHRLAYPDSIKIRTVTNAIKAKPIVKSIIKGNYKDPNETDLLDLSTLPRMLKPNENQEKALRKAISNEFTLIQGPPGTGKTQTCAQLIYNFWKLNKEAKSSKKIIYCGPSNKSVDVMLG